LCEEEKEREREQGSEREREEGRRGEALSSQGQRRRRGPSRPDRR
jgi:hypothetical protein